MLLPFLPEEEIRPTYLATHLPLLRLTERELQMCGHLRLLFESLDRSKCQHISILLSLTQKMRLNHRQQSELVHQKQSR